jgi:hypothetical protein
VQKTRSDEALDNPAGLAPYGRSRDPDVVRFHVALLRIVDGKGSVYDNLATILGSTPKAVKQRVKRARADYKDLERDGPTDELDADDKRYLALRYGRSNDPGVQEWMAKHGIVPQRFRTNRRSGRGAA